MLVDLNLSKTQISSKELAGITNVLLDMNVKWLDLSYNYLNNQKSYTEYNDEFIDNLCVIIKDKGL